MFTERAHWTILITLVVERENMDSNLQKGNGRMYSLHTNRIKYQNVIQYTIINCQLFFAWILNCVLCKNKIHFYTVFCYGQFCNQSWWLNFMFYHPIRWYYWLYPSYKWNLYGEHFICTCMSFECQSRCDYILLTWFIFNHSMDK